MVEVTEPPAVVTTTFTAPAARSGRATVMLVDDVFVIVASVPPKVTLDAVLRFVPVIVTDCAPVVSPVEGLMLLTVGAGVS